MSIVAGLDLLGLGVGRGLAPRAGVGEEDLHAVRAELGGGVEHADAVDVRSHRDLVGTPAHRRACVARIVHRRLNPTATLPRCAKRVLILGSTGSIGEQALDVVAGSRASSRSPGSRRPRNWERLAAQAREHGVAAVALSEPEAAAAGRAPSSTGPACSPARRASAS